jgi:hypothetical protein
MFAAKGTDRAMNQACLLCCSRIFASATAKGGIINPVAALGVLHYRYLAAVGELEGIGVSFGTDARAYAGMARAMDLGIVDKLVAVLPTGRLAKSSAAQGIQGNTPLRMRRRR